MNPDVVALTDRIQKLETLISNLTNTNMIPRNIEDALTGRLSFMNAIGTGTVGSSVTFNAFPVTVPASATGTLTVVVGGVTYNLLYK